MIIHKVEIIIVYTVLLAYWVLHKGCNHDASLLLLVNNIYILIVDENYAYLDEKKRKFCLNAGITYILRQFQKKQMLYFSMNDTFIISSIFSIC